MGRLYSSNTLEVFQDFYPKPNQSSVDLKFLSPPAKEMRESKAVLKKCLKNCEQAWKLVKKAGNMEKSWNLFIPEKWEPWIQQS